MGAKDLALFGLNKRIIVITGHFGAGKTNVAVNLALALQKEGKRVALIDFDIVNPYFRAADNRALLEASGVRTILPTYANTNVDIPVIPAEVSSVFADPDVTAIFDVGGDDVGATALGVYRQQITAAGYDMLYVCNCYRPLTADPADAAALMHDIHTRSGLVCTAMVNNSNLGADTTPETISDSFAWADEVAARCGLPICFDSTTCADAPLSSHPRFVLRDVTHHIYDPS